MGNVYMEASQINYRGGEKKMSVEEALKNTSGEAAAIAQLQQDVIDLNDVKANKITIAPAFSAEASYDPGDLVYYNGLTYRCINAHEGEWDADDFSATTIDNELSELRSGLNGLITIGYFSATLAVGDNLLREADGTAGSVVTSGDLPTGNDVFMYVDNAGSSNSATFSFHEDGSGTIKVIHCNTTVAQSVGIKWIQFNV